MVESCVKKGTIRANAPTQHTLINFDKRGKGAGGMKSNHLEMVPYFTNTGIEKQVKKENDKKRISHLARHGYFAP